MPEMREMRSDVTVDVEKFRTLLEHYQVRPMAARREPETMPESNPTPTMAIPNRALTTKAVTLHAENGGKTITMRETRSGDAIELIVCGAGTQVTVRLTKVELRELDQMHWGLRCDDSVAEDEKTMAALRTQQPMDEQPQADAAAAVAGGSYATPIPHGSYQTGLIQRAVQSASTKVAPGK